MQTREQLDVDAFRAIMTTFRDTVKDHAGGLNRLNVYPVPDGDTGTNMSRTLDAVIAEMESAPSDDMVATCDAVSHGSLMGARGNSGVILSQVLRGLVSTIKARAQRAELGDGVDDGLGSAGREFAEALTNASTAAYQAVLKPMEGTILTVVRESAEAAMVASEGDAGLIGVVRAAKQAGQASLERTPDLLPVLKDAGVVDAGGAGFLLLLDAALHVLDDEPLPPALEGDDLDAVERAAAVAHRGDGDGGLDVSEQRYEVMYFLDLDDAQIDAFKTGWGEIGDSIVVVGGDGIWNCHIHTNDIGAAIEVPLELGGRPKQIRVTDLFEEVGEEHARREAELTGAEPHVASRAGAGLPPVTTAVVAVATGDGIAELFAQLRVQGFVRGGQTMNPSTAELLDVIEHVNADQVVILPNNKNIIPVAEQVDALTTKSVHVVPTRTLVQALGALIVYDPEADAAENVAEMAEAADSVVSGEVTRAVRDSNTPAGAVSEGDWMGMVDGEGIVALSGTALGASTELLDHMLTGDGELLTIIVGEGADRDTTNALLAWMADSHAEVQVEVHAGGQPLYPFLFGLE